VQEDAAIGIDSRSACSRVREIKLIRSECDAVDPDQVITQASAPDGVDLVDRCQVEIADERHVASAFRTARPHDKRREIDDRVAMLLCRVPENPRLACTFPVPSSPAMAGAAAHLRRPEGKVSLAAAILSVVLATVLLPWAMPHLYAK